VSTDLRTQLFTKTQSAEYKRRRRSLMRVMGDNAIAIIPTSRVAYRNRDTEYPFRADSNFLYLSGFAEPEALMVLVPNRKAGQYIMFCRERDPTMDVLGSRMPHKLSVLMTLFQSVILTTYYRGCSKVSNQSSIPWVRINCLMHSFLVG